MSELSLIWTPTEREAWRPPDDLTGSEWAERHYVIPPKGNAEPGPYRISRTPYLRRILDDACDNVVQKLDVIKGVQVGGSKFTELAAGYCIDVRGDDALVVFPTQKIAEDRLKKRFAPMFEETPTLRRWLADERFAVSKEGVDFKHATLYPGWPSASALASKPIRLVILDEIDKYPGIADEAEAIELAEMRTQTYGHRRKIIRLSTPTSRNRGIAKLWDVCPNQREWHVPCPHCGVFIRLEFDQISWPGQSATGPKDMIEQVRQLEEGEVHARYTCQECGEDFGEAERLAIQQQGEWCQEGYPPGELPPAVHVGYRIPSINSPWVSLNQMAWEYLKGLLTGSQIKFKTNYLATAHEDEERATSQTLYHERATAEPYSVPEWATVVTAGADTQKDHFPYVVRAWGPTKYGLRSRLLDFGKALSVADLKAKTVDAKFKVEGSDLWVKPTVLLVDSGGGVENSDGTTRDTVYRMALADPHRVVPIKGHGGTKAPDREIRVSPQRYLLEKADARSVKLAILDTQGLKDQMADMINRGDPILWEENANVSDEYASHMSGEAKMLVKVGQRLLMRWGPKAQGRHVDWWDASIYCFAGAKMLQASKRKPEHQRAVEVQRAPAARPLPQRRTPPRGRGGWLAKKPGRR